MLLVTAVPTGEELASTLSFLMQLSFRQVWQPYPLAQLSDKEQQIAAHMAQLGLVHTFVQVWWAASLMYLLGAQVRHTLHSAGWCHLVAGAICKFELAIPALCRFSI